MASPAAPGPLAGPRLWNRAAPDYLRDIAPGLALFAEDALRLGRVEAGTRLADVACGPGSLSLAAARRGARPSALDFSPDMIALLRAEAARAGLMVEARVGDGQALPWPDASFDVACSLFGLIFFPDRGRGLAELRRVLRPGGRAVLASWVPASEAPVIAEVWGTLAAELLDLPYTRVRPALGDPETFRAELAAAGFVAIEVERIEHGLEVPSVLDYWAALQRSTPPLIAVRESVPETRWTELSARVGAALTARYGDGPVRVGLRAFVGGGQAG